VQLLARARAGVRSTKLSASEARLRTLIANVPGAIYRCANDRDWTMELISDDIERISGYPPTDFIGNACRTFASIIHPDERGQVERMVAEATQQGQLFALEYRIVRSDGSLAWVLERRTW
jgi:PAS domain S-box-containing protein